MVTTTRYIYDGNQYLAEADETDTINRLYTNEPAAYTHLISQEEVSTGDTLTYHYDALGSTRSVTDDTETVTDEFTYDAWGNRLSRTGTNDIPFQYVGEHGYYREDATESYYVMARNYQPSIARWWSVDPISLLVDSFIYIYSANTPIILIDASGLTACLPTIWSPQGCKVDERCSSCRGVLCELESTSSYLDLVDCAKSNDCLGDVICTAGCPPNVYGGFFPKCNGSKNIIRLCGGNLLSRDPLDFVKVIFEELYHALTLCPKGTTPAPQSIKHLNGIISAHDEKYGLTSEEADCLRFAGEEMIAKYCAGACWNYRSCLSAALGSKLVSDACLDVSFPERGNGSDDGTTTKVLKTYMEVIPVYCQQIDSKCGSGPPPIDRGKSPTKL